MAISATLKKLRAANRGTTIRDAADRAFGRYGRVLGGVKAKKAVAFAKKNAAITDEVVYAPSVRGLEADTAFVKAMESGPFGGMPVQVGWCYGRNSLLDALEYHKGIEVVVAVTDIAVIVGDQRDIAWRKNRASYPSRKAEVFFVRAGTAVEFHCWCLHFAPIHVRTNPGFCTLVVLPKKTNTDIPLPKKPRGEDALLFARNKWLLAHRSATGLVEAGAAVGITGRNLEIHPIS